MAYQSIKLAFKYACTVVESYVRRMQPDYILTKTEIRLGNGTSREFTSYAISQLANGNVMYMQEQGQKENGVVVCTYNIKGNGPYMYKIDELNRTFPPNQPTRDMIPVDEQIIFVDLYRLRKKQEDDDETKSKEEKDESDIYEEESEDMTDIFIAFAGPDGLYHGRGSPDLPLILPTSKTGDKVSITYGSGKTTDLFV